MLFLSLKLDVNLVPVTRLDKRVVSVKDLFILTTINVSGLMTITIVTHTSLHIGARL